LTGADIAILIVVLVSALVGLLRGFIKEVFSLANWVAALILAYLFRDPVGAILPLGESVSPLIRSSIGGILIFVITLIVGGLLVTLIHKVAHASGLSGTDRTLGVVFGLLRGCVIILALLILLPAISPIEEQGWWQASVTIPLFLGFEEWATTLVADLVNWVTGRISG
jgi:membrane protein required for colicin V production